MEDSLAGDVGHKEGSCFTLATKGTGAQMTFLVTVEDNAHMLQVDQFGASLLAHDLDSVLVTQEVAAFYGVVSVVSPVITAIRKGRIDTTLSSV
jgi:hypothetical protein